jgi:hypothetical protein
VFEQIRAAKPTKLYIACDAPRKEKGAGEVQRVDEVKEILSAIDWPCEVYRKYASENLGCGVSVSGAIAWALEKEEAIIILEDDCVPEQTFFSFCDEMLDRYAQDDRVGAINGTSILPQTHSALMQKYPSSYYFSKTHCVWGWATWKRVWREYAFDMPQWPHIKAQKHLQHYWMLPRTYHHVVKHLELILSGKVDSWDFQLVTQYAIQNQLIVHPCVNLVENIGAGVDAHHNKIKSKLNNIPSQPIQFPLKHPESVTHHGYFDLFLERYYTQPRWLIAVKTIVFPYIKRFIEWRANADRS